MLDQLPGPTVWWGALVVLVGETRRVDVVWRPYSTGHPAFACTPECRGLTGLVVNKMSASRRLTINSVFIYVSHDCLVSTHVVQF